MAKVHFLNVLEGGCNIIQHDSDSTTVIDVSNAYNDYDTPEEIAKKNSLERKKCSLEQTYPLTRKIMAKRRVQTIQSHI